MSNTLFTIRVKEMDFRKTGFVTLTLSSDHASITIPFSSSAAGTVYGRVPKDAPGHWHSLHNCNCTFIEGTVPSIWDEACAPSQITNTLE